MAVLTIKLFGNPSILVDGREVVLPYRRAEALLYYLLLNRKVSRSDLVRLLCQLPGKKCEDEGFGPDD